MLELLPSTTICAPDIRKENNNTKMVVSVVK